MTWTGRAVIAAALPVAATLAVWPSGLAPFGPVKWLAVTTLVFAALAAVLWRRAELLLARAPMWAWLAFLVLVVVAAAFALDRVYAWTGTPERHFGVLAWLLCACTFVIGQALDAAEARLVAIAAAFATSVFGLWAVAETLGWRPFNLVGAGSRPVATFGSSAYLGAAVALLGPIALAFALDPRLGRAGRIVAAVGAAASAVALVASGARAAWAGVLFAAGVVLFIRRRRIQHARRVAAAMIGVAAIAVVIALATGVGGRALDVVRDRQGGARGRLDEWRVAARVVDAHPLIGVGPEGYRIAFGRYVDARYEEVHGRAVLPDRAHDALLDVATTIGIPGLLAYLALLLCAARFVVRALRDGSLWVVGIATGLIAYVAQSLFLFPIAELEPVAWLLAGIVVAQCARRDEQHSFVAPRFLSVVGGLLAVVALAAGTLDVAADADAKVILNEAGNGRVVTDPGLPAHYRPDQLRYRLLASRADEALGSIAGLDRAIAQVDDALDVSPKDPVARSEQARLLLERAQRTGIPADAAKARRALERLTHDDPRNAQTLLRLGLARELTGDDAGAETAWLEAERLAPTSSAPATDLALLYERREDWRDAAAAARRALGQDPTDALASAVLEQARKHGT
jgi:O-antigen ligase